MQFLAVEYCSTKGLPHRFITKHGQGGLSITDPLGMPLELFFQMDQADCMLRNYACHRGAAPQRIDHVNCFTPNVQVSHEFYTDIGFRTTEYTETEDSQAIWAIWMHRKGNVHDIAFTNGYGPRLHHIGIWVRNR